MQYPKSRANESKVGLPGLCRVQPGLHNVKRRANLLYKLRRHGVECNTKLRVIYLPYFDTPEKYPQIPRLCREFHFNVQYIII